MREIKFRAWAKGKRFKKGGKMYYSTHYDLEFDGLDWYMGEREYEDFDIVASYDKDSILMQFTGLKDKNEKEIYEGDIVNFSEHYIGDYRQFEETEVIKFEGSGFNDNLNVGFHDLPEWCEVIGNIYENPELCDANVAKEEQ